MKCLSVLLLLLLGRFFGSTLAAQTCTQTLSDADNDASGGLSLIEYRSFLEQEAAKNGIVVVTTSTSIDPESPIARLFTTLAGNGAAGEIDITGASATDRSQIPARQQAILELICVKSKALIQDLASNSPDNRQPSNSVMNSPFRGENNQHQGTPKEIRQENGGFTDLYIFGMHLYQNEDDNFCEMEYSLLVSAMLNTCPNLWNICPKQENTGASLNGAIPDCPELETQFCDALAFLDQAPGCCLKQATTQIYDLTVCYLRETLGVERANCSIPQCMQDVVTTAAPTVPTAPTFPIFRMELDFFGKNPMSFPYCKYPVESFVRCTSENCTDFLQSCRDPSASTDANFSLAIGNSNPSTCSEFGAAVCDAMADLPESCCLSSCLYEIYTLAQCTAQGAEPEKEPKGECFPYPHCFADFLVESEGGLWQDETVSVDIFQGFFFDFFGTILSEEVVIAECIEQANSMWACMGTDCPNFMGTCFNEFLSFPWSYGPEADSFFFNPQSFPRPAPAYFFVNSQSVDLTPANFGCANMTNAFCELFNFPDTCCLSKCMNPLYTFVACLADFAIGNNSDLEASCPAPMCEHANETSNHSMLDIGLVSVNSSFLISTLDGIKAASLKEDLQGEDRKYVKVLQEAYVDVVEAVVDSLSGGSDRRHLVGSSHTGFETNTRSRRMQETTPKLDPSSAEVYKFVDIPCNTTAIGAVSRQSETTQNCISVFGKYSLLIDPEENPMEVYNQFMAETTSFISEGKLQESLQAVAAGANKTTTFPFVVEGVSPLYDSTFVPINSNGTGLGKNVSVPLSTDLVATDDSDGTGLTSSPANGTLKPDADVSTASPTNGSLTVMTAAPSGAYQGLGKLSWLGLCFGAVWLSGM